MMGSRNYDPRVFTFLEKVYAVCNRPERLCRDPLALVVAYGDLADREIAGLICSTLAFGSVDLILEACSRALAPLGPRPALSLDAMGEDDLRQAWGKFQYRFCFAEDLIALLRAAKEARRRYGSLEALFAAGDRPNAVTASSLSAFVGSLRSLGAQSAAGGPAKPIRPNLLPDPAQGSACKRLFLFLRWMVRKDDVDPGGWTALSPSRLIVPLDVHMAATCVHTLGFLAPGRAERQPGLRDSLAATARFALYSPEDPVKYDFALTRPGIDPRPGDAAFGCR